MAELELEAAVCAFTSGDYERYFEHEGERFHHILDPRSGYPATGATNITVLHTNAALADAAATALLVAGADGWESVARDLGIKQVMLVAIDGSVQISPDLTRRIRFLTDPPEIVTVAEVAP